MHRDKVFKLAKGFRGRAKNCIRIARERVEKSLQYAFRDRKATACTHAPQNLPQTKKRDMRSLWITRITAGSRQYGVKYSQLIHGLKQENIEVNRKVLSELAMNEPYSFKALVDQVRFMHGSGASSSSSSASSSRAAAAVPAAPK
ncbi:50S ribosomal protein L20 [Chlorella vulgaris]